MVGKVEFDSGSGFFTLRFSVLNRSRMGMLSGMQSERDTVPSTTDQAYNKFNVTHDIHLNLFGLHFNIDELRMVLRYSHKEREPHLFAQINQPPKKVNAYGRAFGFVPIWLINLLIPSSLEKITHDFFEALAASNEGKGAETEIGSMSMGPSKETFWITTDADVLSNGTIKFLFNLRHRLFAEKQEFSEEIRSFRNQMWYAFYQDFELFMSGKSAGKQQPITSDSAQQHGFAGFR